MNFCIRRSKIGEVKIQTTPVKGAVLKYPDNLLNPINRGSGY
jgi:hypothetical protein